MRDDAHEVLTRWTAPDAEQERLRLVYLDHLEAHVDAMSRDCHPDHLTASVIIVADDRTRVLLTLHKRIRRWLQTGGHCEPGDASLVDAALREGREESGLTSLSIDPEPVLLSLHEVPGCGPVRPSHHLDVQFVGVAADDSIIISDESDDLAWFAIDDLPADTDQSVRDLIAAATTRLRGIPSPSPSADRR
nr:NUDIX domain-containing protein [Aeromicrobium stalagmiti]